MNRFSKASNILSASSSFRPTIVREDTCNLTVMNITALIENKDLSLEEIRLKEYGINSQINTAIFAPNSVAPPITGSYIMLKSCFENQCSDDVTYLCNCKDPNIYICDNHLLKHTRSPGKHSLESLTIELDYNQKIDFFPKFKEIITYIHKLKKTILISGKQLTDCIEKEIRKYARNLKDLERNILKLLSSKIISKEDYSKIFLFDSSINRLAVGKVNNLKAGIKELFVLEYNGLS